MVARVTVYLPNGCKTYYYDFQYAGHRHTGTTHQTIKADAELVEQNAKIRLRRERAGIATFDPANTPRFADFAEVVLRYQRQFVTRPDLVARTLVVVLEFWGAKPAMPRKAPAVPRARRVEAPFHDLRLGDPIADASWLLAFQEWMDARGVSGSTRNTYLSTMSGFYRVALQPEYRQVAGIDRNPFSDIRRSPPNPRVIALEPAQVLAWIAAAPYHVALAATIAALAPKLRLQTILRLRWGKEVALHLKQILVYQHKTAARTGAPQVTPISEQLREILSDARSRTTSAFVIAYRNKPVASIKKSVRRAAEASGLLWGVRDGVTFHTLRHSIATLLADLGLAERLRMELLGHKEIRTTQQYTHLAAKSQIDPHEQLSAALPLRDLMLAKGKRVGAGQSSGPRLRDAEKLAEKRRKRSHREPAVLGRKSG